MYQPAIDRSKSKRSFALGLFFHPGSSDLDAPVIERYMTMIVALEFHSLKRWDTKGHACIWRIWRGKEVEEKSPRVEGLHYSPKRQIECAFHSTPSHIVIIIIPSIKRDPHVPYTSFQSYRYFGIRGAGAFSERNQKKRGVSTTIECRSSARQHRLKSKKRSKTLPRVPIQACRHPPPSLLSLSLFALYWSHEGRDALPSAQLGSRGSPAFRVPKWT